MRELPHQFDAALEFKPASTYTRVHTYTHPQCKSQTRRRQQAGGEESRRKGESWREGRKRKEGGRGGCGLTYNEIINLEKQNEWPLRLEHYLSDGRPARKNNTLWTHTRTHLANAQRKICKQARVNLKASRHTHALENKVYQKALIHP